MGRKREAESFKEAGVTSHLVPYFNQQTRTDPFPLPKAQLAVRLFLIHAPRGAPCRPPAGTAGRVGARWANLQRAGQRRTPHAARSARERGLPTGLPSPSWKTRPVRRRGARRPARGAHRQPRADFRPVKAKSPRRRGRPSPRPSLPARLPASPAPAAAPTCRSVRFLSGPSR